MAFGPGKYDALCTYVREQAKALGVILLVFGGEHGSGFSVQGVPEMQALLPVILRRLAEDIEKSGGGRN